MQKADQLGLIQVNIQEKFEKSLCSILSQDKFCEQLNVGNIFRNELAEACIPKNVKASTCNVALKSDVSGNCLYSTFSLFLTGSNILVDHLRLLTSIELYLHANFYTNFLQKEGVALPYCVSFN